MAKNFALIVGASGEIGQTISRKLAEAGWSLYLHYASNERFVKLLLDDLTLAYPAQEFILVQANLLEVEAVEHMAASIFSLKAVVFSQGHSLFKGLEDTSAQDIRQLFQVHIEHPMLLLAQLASKLRVHDSASIVFIGSIWGETGASYESAYSAAKGAQHAFVKAYAKEVALQHINVNAVAPGFIDTNMNAHVKGDERQMLLDEIPMGVFGLTADVANTVAFLVSNQARYITGQIIRVNGGWYI